MIRTISISLLLFLAFLSAASASGSVELRDITVTPLGGRATITFLVSGPVGTVVVEKKGPDVAQVRMKSLAADDAALNSALPKPGLLSISAHIERTDVLVTNARFLREVQEIAVLKREADRIVVGVRLGRQLKQGERREYSNRTVVIDPGHGGNDPGATGLDGVVEKGVTLQIALLLRNELKKRMPGLKVILTREDDRYVELEERGAIANRADADLFISLHCNATDERPHPAEGFECWIWRPTPDTATGVAARENSSGGGGAARTASAAAEAATAASRSLANTIRSSLRSGTRLRDRGIHQANFYVLVGTRMPAVLVELGYLTNRKDQDYLTSTAGQQQIAVALADAIRRQSTR